MSTERDELAQILFDGRGNTIGETVNDILLAGYRKPRTITTTEELDALPECAVILESLGYPWQKINAQWVAWLNPGEDSVWLASGRRGPFTVLYEPEATA